MGNLIPRLIGALSGTIKGKKNQDRKDEAFFFYFFLERENSVDFLGGF